jgi:hypothetical protein
MTDNSTQQGGYGVTPFSTSLTRPRVIHLQGEPTDKQKEEDAAAEASHQRRQDGGATVRKIEAYLLSYLSFPDETPFLPLALFVMLEHCWNECFDEVPYLLISAATQSSGKTRVLELLWFLAGEKAILFSGDITRASLYSEISTRSRVVLIDEGERLQSRNSPFRAILNSGHRRGQTVFRKIGKENVEFSIYCPKVIAVIGDVYGSLRDRCITIEMHRMRQGPRKEFVRQVAQEEGRELASEIAEVVRDREAYIRDAYLNYHGLYPSMDFLRDRDREIWKPLFALCQVLAPERMQELEKCAADIAAFKTRPIRRLGDLQDAEERTQRLEFAEQLLGDALTAIGTRDRIASTDLVKGLRDIPTSPWRGYEGPGITAMSLAAMLKLFGVEPRTIRVKPKDQPGATVKGYYARDLASASRP